MSANEALNALSTTDASNTPNDGDSVGSTLDDELRSIKANIARAGRFEGTATVTAAATLPVTLLSKSLPVDGSAGGSTTLTLPAAATAGNGFLFYVFKSGTQNNVILDGSGAETIDGATTFTLSAQYSGLFLLCDGAGWGTFRDDRKPIRRESYGLVPSNGTDATNDIDFTAGACWDTTSANWIVVAALTKQADAPWAAGTNQGMIDTGSFAADSCYYFWAILHTDGTTDILMSLADTWASVTKPSGYTTGQLIHALPTLPGSTAWTPATITESNVRYSESNTQVAAYTTLVTNTVAVHTVSVPKLSMGNFGLWFTTSTAVSAITLSIETADRVGGAVEHYDWYIGQNTAATTHAGCVGFAQVDTSSQIGTLVSWSAGNDTLYVYALGYDFTRRFAGA